MNTVTKTARPYLNRYDGVPLCELSKSELIDCLNSTLLESKSYNFYKESLTYRKKTRATINYLISLIDAKQF